MAGNLTGGTARRTGVDTRRRPALLLLSFSLALVLAGAAGCSGKDRLSQAGSAVQGASSPQAASGAAFDANPARGGTQKTLAAGSGGGAAQAEVPTGPRIVRNGEVSLRVAKGGLNAAFDRLSAAASGRGGFVADSSITASTPADAKRGVPETVGSARLTLRVPVARLDDLLAELPSVGTVESKSLKGDDVSSQLVDMEARLTNLRAEEAAFRAILAKATAIGDVLNVQQQVFGVRQQIEVLDAQRAALTNKADLATLAISLQEPPLATTPVVDPDEGVFAHAWRLARENTASVFEGLVLTLGYLAPVLPLVVLGALLVWRRRRQVAAEKAVQPAG